MGEVKISERGWAGHFVCANSCKFRRNTLIEYEDKKWIVSTVGALCIGGKTDTIGAGNRYYETMAFKAKKCGFYWDIDVSQQLDFKSNWAIDKIDFNSDLIANEMHDNVVKELSLKITE